MSFRITLDRSVFHGENFNRLASSSLEKACRSRKIAIYHTPILIEETLNLWLKPEKRDGLKEHLCFLITIGNGRIFKDRGEIWSGELEGKSEREYLFLSKTDQENKITFLNRFAKKEENVEDLVKEVLPIKANNREKASNLRKIFVGKRNETAQSRKLSPNLPKSSLSFESYYDLNCDALGAGVIRSHVNYAVADTAKWEQSAAYVLDTHPLVAAFVKNAGLGFAIPYLHNGQVHDYVPDFIVRLKTAPERHLILETKGFDPLEEVKVSAARRWVSAVNADGTYGAWAYVIAKKVSDVAGMLAQVAGAAD